MANQAMPWQLTAGELRAALKGVSDEAVVILQLPRGFRSHTELTTLYNLEVTHQQDPILKLGIKNKKPPLPEAVCCVIRNKENPAQILLVSRKDDPNVFGLPGGKVDERDASPLAATLREVREETGLDVVLDEYPIFAEVCPRHAPEGVDYFAYAFVALNYSGELRTQESGVLKWGTWKDQESGTFADYNKGVQKALASWPHPSLKNCRDYGGNCGGCDICCPDDELWK
jgi:ADP-ribose pyrophosphatase YjhB (NUDIX family)